MSEADMRRALMLISDAKSAQRQLNEYVLLVRDSSKKGETIQVGDPVTYRNNEYHRLDVPIPEDARRYVFRLWRKEVARRFNAMVRELNQLGASHDFKLVGFDPATGEPS